MAARQRGVVMEGVVRWWGTGAWWVGVQSTEMEILEEENKAYDSQSNGKVEHAIQRVEKTFPDLEGCLGFKAQVQSAKKS